MLDAFGTKQTHLLDINETAACIAKVQRQNGEIPWYKGLKTDPWDMVEAAMGLSIGGFTAQAENAYMWLAHHQNPDGSWYTAYKNSRPYDTTRDANLSAYIAVGVYHHFLITGNQTFLNRMWPTIGSAIDFAISLQAPRGEIYWAISPAGMVDKMALLTGSCSILMSIRCALAIAGELGYQKRTWMKGFSRLYQAIAYHPQRFNMTKARYAMDWYYPVLCGIITGEKAHHRIDHLWKKFVIEGQGVRCVSDRPWITIAETSELCLALSAMGRRTMAEIIYNWIVDKRYDDGWFWAGYTTPDRTVWPDDKLSWTNAAVLLAADALYDLTPASGLFSHRF